MIYFNLAGGIGNMMFQTATAEYLAQEHDKELCYPNARDHFSFLFSFGRWVAHSREYHGVFENVDWFKNYEHFNDPRVVKKIGFAYEEIYPQEGVEYHGYFQSYKNFNQDDARHLFKPRNHVMQSVDGILGLINPQRPVCSIHVRRGNYLEHQDKHVVQDVSYYAKAIDVMRMNGVKSFLIFSDDIPWCKQNFIGEEFHFIKDVDYVEMFLMSQCDHNIIGNSSFSWWGAYLGNPEGRIVIAPDNWFPNNKPDASDIVPPNWIKL